MKKLLYKAGYMFEIQTWENDADNYNKATLSGLTEAQASLLSDICKVFFSKNRYQNTIGNMYEPSEDEVSEAAELLSLVFIEHDIEIDKEDDQYKDEPFEYLNNKFYEQFEVEFYDLHLTGGDFFTRVCDTVTVSLIKEDFYVDDKTKKYGLK